jgi:ribulose-5-phosphate 4-epimerase/fuculose-1-phosphate aldolase
MNDLPRFTAMLQAGVQRLQDKGFITQACDTVSLRLPGEDAMLLWREHGPVVLPLSSAEPGDAAVHAACYRQRPDAGAVALLSPAWSLLLHQSGRPPVTLFDEQARHLGRPWRPWQTLPDKLLTSGNAGELDGQLLVLGVTPRRMLFNAELYEKCAKAAVLANATRHPVHRLPWWVCRIAAGRLRADQARAAASHRAGREAEELQAY